MPVYIQFTNIVLLKNKICSEHPWCKMPGPVLWQGLLETDILLAVEFPWGGSRSLLQEPKSFFFLTFYRTQSHLNLKPPPKELVIHWEGQGRHLKSSSKQGGQGAKLGLWARVLTMCHWEKPEMQSHHASHPANAPLSAFLREGEVFSPLHLFSSQFTRSGLMLPRYRSDQNLLLRRKIHNLLTSLWPAFMEREQHTVLGWRQRINCDTLLPLFHRKRLLRKREPFSRNPDSALN